MATAQILVTGGSGFVGSHLLPALRARFPGRDIAAPAFDVADSAAADAIAHAQPGTIIHLAAIAAPADARRDPETAWRVNLHGTLNVARAAHAVPGCTLLFASTADAYGHSFAAGRALDETAPLAPLNAYGATKAAADLALGAMAAEGLRVVRLRPFNHTGPGQSDAFAVPAFARQIARIEAGVQPPVIEVGALDAVRDFLDVRDVCDAYVRCVDRALAPGTILNIASGVGRRVGDVLAELIALSGVAAEIRTDHARLRPTDIASAVGDPARARAALDWAPLVPWERTLAETLEFWRRDTG